MRRRGGTKRPSCFLCSPKCIIPAITSNTASQSSEAWISNGTVPPLQPLTLSDVSSDQLARRQGQAQSGAKQRRMKWRRSLRAGQFNFLKNTWVQTTIRTFHITFSLPVPFSKSHLGWKGKKVEEWFGQYKKKKRECHVVFVCWGGKLKGYCNGPENFNFLMVSL